jgi:tRNA uridine 5-carboxymethylaminomethyl modification enzyme
MLQEDTQVQIDLLRKTQISVDHLGGWKTRFRRRDKVSLAEFLRQPGVGLRELLPLLRDFEGIFSKNSKALQRAAISIRYEGYINKQQREIEKFKKLENSPLPNDFSFEYVPALRTEAREKFQRFRPASLGQAGRIEGITPGDVAILSVALRKHLLQRG